MKKRWAGRIGGLVLAISLLLLAGIGPGVSAGAEPATPGARFVYELCDSGVIASGNPAAAETVIPNNDFSSFDTCSEPGGLVGLREGPWVDGGPAAVRVSVSATPGGFVESDSLTASASGMDPGNARSYVGVEGWPPQDGRPHTRVIPFRTQPPASCDRCDLGGSFEIFMSCGDGQQCGSTGQIGAGYIAATEVDPVPPVIGKIEGSLQSGGTLRGRQTLSASASDQGGGLSSLTLLINGTVAPVPVPGSCAVYPVNNSSYRGVVTVSPSPCQEELTGTWTLNTAAPPFHEGANTVQVCASDFSTIGPANTTCSPPQSVEVDDSCVESAVDGGRELKAQFSEGHGGALTVGFEEPAEIVGEVTGSLGGLAGATVCIESQVEGDAADPETVGTALTDSSGHFTYDLPAGPNRQLIVGYRHDSFQVSKTLTFGSRARPAIELDHGRIGGGGTIGIDGSLPGPGSAGRVVVLQASALHGRRWLTFRRATTGSRGGFHATYRFGATSSTTTYRIRASVPRQEGYPWEPGHSVPKRVKVVVRKKAKPARSGDHAGRRHAGRHHRGAASERRRSHRRQERKHSHGGIEA